MESLHSLERVVSQKAIQMGSSSSCKICVVGFLCGVCLATLFLAALSSFGGFQLGEGIAFSAFSSGSSSGDFGSKNNYFSSTPKEKYEANNSAEDTTPGIDERVRLIHSAWSNLLSESVDVEDRLPGRHTQEGFRAPKAPHLENCQKRTEISRRLDSRTQTENIPPWTIWKGMLDNFPLSTSDQQQMHRIHPLASEAVYPPWITGSDEENYPLTRKAQRDIWFHQHPSNCNDPGIKFLVADWERLPGFGIGAQIAGMCGLLSIALNEDRVLVTSYYNRADHDECKGSSRSSWSCYFFPETSEECRERAFELMKSNDALERGIVTVKENYTSKQIWAGHTPRLWGDPWSYMQPTTEINGSLIASHRKMDRRWWRAQAVRYLMRFPSEYTCNLLNVARHEAFGWEAAKLVLATSSADLAEDARETSDIEKYVWSNHDPWIPRPLLSMHVRMGDKACEMKVVGFEDYMILAERIRNHFPHLNRIWLSTEMQEVIDKTKSYPSWRFHYTNVTRQVGNITMATYEASLGRKTSTNYPLVNFLMASQADFFIGALGSTWCFLIDGMRNTGGKVMSGYLSVNKDRFW